VLGLSEENERAEPANPQNCQNPDDERFSYLPKITIYPTIFLAAIHVTPKEKLDIVL
jgi:hypothetical protein